MLIFVMPAIFPYDENRQAGNYIYEQCEVLKRHEYDLVILDCSSRNYKNWRKCNRMFSYSSPVGKVYVNWVRGLAQSKLPRLAVSSYIKNAEEVFKRALEECGTPDVIYAHFTFPCGWAARYFSGKYNIPYIVQEHYSLFLRKNLPQYLKDITRKTIEDSSSFYCVSNSLKRNIADFTGLDQKIGVVHNLIHDQYRYYPLPDNREFIFFTAGNLFKGKRFDLLIDAFCQAFTSKDKVKLRIAGAGTEYAVLKQRIEERGRTSQILLLGRLNSDEMLEEYKNCHCFALLSEKETFGIVYREAMAVGRPVIAAKNGGIEENWQETFGILVARNHLEESAKALNKIVENYNTYHAEKISEATLAMYASENIIQSIIKIMENI